MNSFFEIIYRNFNPESQPIDRLPPEVLFEAIYRKNNRKQRFSNKKSNKPIKNQKD
jgi:hypothetical protein